MAEPVSAQARLDKIVTVIAANMVAEVCSFYVMRADNTLELFATEGLNREAVHLTTMRAGEGLVGLIAESAEPLALADAHSHPAFSYKPETGEEIYHSFLGVPILRAGLGMVDGILRLVPSARVGHIGLYRDHDTLEPVDYYFKIPADAPERDFLLLDPMLATGGSAVAAITALKRAGAQRIRFLCLVAAPAGVTRVHEAHPDVPIICAALDRELNEHGYILPGLGDAGDRLFGTR